MSSLEGTAEPGRLRPCPDDADRVARTIRKLLDSGETVLDPRAGDVRPLVPGDFMIRDPQSRCNPSGVELSGVELC